MTLDELANEVAREIEGIAGPSEPRGSGARERWLGDGQRASVGVLQGRVVIWIGATCEELAVPDHAALERVRPAIREGVRAQIARYESHVPLDARLRDVGRALASALGARLGKTLVLSAPLRSRHDAPIEGDVLDASNRSLVHLRTEHGVLRGHAGLAGDDGWDAPIVEAGDVLDAIVEALALRSRSLTREGLRRGARYRVLASIQGLTEGTIARYRGFDDVDNHYGRHLFEAEDGTEIAIVGDFSRRDHGPLADAHRYLVAVD